MLKPPLYPIVAVAWVALFFAIQAFGAADEVLINETVTDGFKHPGIGLTKEALENARAQVIARRDPWYSGYKKLAAHPNSAESVSCRNQSRQDPSKPDSDTFDNRGMVARLAGDSDKAFRQALMYYFTGKEVHRANAMNIIRVWSKLDPQKFRSFPEDHIHACYPVQNLIRAAELIRYTSSPKPELNWTSEDSEAFSRNFVTPSVATFFSRNGHFMNQAGYPIAAAMSGAIFLNDRKDYETRVEWFTVNKTAPNKGWSFSIKDLARLVDTNALTGEKVATPAVQLMEMGRDQAHAGDDVEIFMNVARLMNAQGTKVDPVDGTVSVKANAVGPYEFLDDRILAASDYFCRFMLGYDTPWVPVPYDIGPDGKTRAIYPRIADNYRGRIRGFDFWDAYYYYACRKGVNVAKKAPYFHEAFSKRIVSSDTDWIYIPAQVSGEGAKVPQTEQEPNAVEVEQRCTVFDDKAAVVQNADAVFVRITPAETGTRLALLSMDTDRKTIGMRVRTTGVAEVGMSGFAKPWLLPDTKGQWRYVTYTMGKLERFRDIVYFTIKGPSGAQVDLDQLTRSGEIKPTPVFKDGGDELSLVAYVDAPVTFDFSPASPDASTAASSYDKPAGSVLDGATGVFSWRPKQSGTYRFVVNLANGETITAKRVSVFVALDRESAVLVANAFDIDKATAYVSATRKNYDDVSNQLKTLGKTTNDQVFFAKLVQLQKAIAELKPLTPRLPDGSLDFPKVVASSDVGESIGLLADGNDDTFPVYTIAKDFNYVFDFGDPFRFSATAFALEGRLNFEDRAENTAFFGSNDGKSWTQLTPPLNGPPTELIKVEVSKDHSTEAFRYLKVEKLNRRGLFEPSELRIYGQRHEVKP